MQKEVEPELICENYDVLQEVLLKLKLRKQTRGKKLKVVETPITFDKRLFGNSKRRLIAFIISYMKSVFYLSGIRLKAAFQSLIWVNLAHNSELVKWFVNNVRSSQTFDTAHLTELGYDYFASSFTRTTIEYAFSALMQVFKYSPIGEDLQQGEAFDKKLLVRNEYKDLSEITVAYSLYKYAQKMETTALRVKDFYEDESEGGIAKEFCLTKEHFEKLLRTLNSAKNRVLNAELNMGLNHITLEEGLTPMDVLKRMF